MQSHLNIQVNGKDLALPADFAIDIEEANPLFNDNEMYTFPVSIPLEGNRHLVQNMEDIHADVRPVNLEHTPMRIIAEGIPFRSGVAVVDESQEIKDSLSFSIQSVRESFQDIISDLNCQDIPLKDKIQIGEMIGEVHVRFQYDYKIIAKFEEDHTKFTITPTKGESPFDELVDMEIPLQALGFSYPFVAQEDGQYNAVRNDKGPNKIENFINVSEGYPQKPYCNTRVCYKHYAKGDDGTSSDAVSHEGEYGPFYVLDADRPQSGICFYVLYFLDCLFHHLQLNYDMSRLLEIEDLKKLFFFNTACKYTLERKYPERNYIFTNLEQINEWISSRATNIKHCGKLDFVPSEEKSVNSITLHGVTYEIGKTVERQSKSLTLSSCKMKLGRWVSNVKANIMKMYASPDNFPEETVSTILDSLWNSFGVKFLFNYETKLVKAVLIRDVYRDPSAPVDLPCRVISITKIAEKVTGVKMTYSAESDEKEQRRNVKRGVKDYDTNFDYIDYAKTDATLSYEQILKKRSNSDMTTYVDMNTGNAYRLKVDADAETVSELNARLFEVGGYKGITLGDCSPINDDFVEHLEIGWSPMLFTDVNIINEMAVGEETNITCSDENGNEIVVNGVNRASREQILAAFVEDEMWHENITFNIDNAVCGDHADAVLRESLTTDESYDPQSTEDGNSPLQHADWGTAVGVMRGGGTDMTLQKYDYDYDGFGNFKWRIVAGKYAVSSDSIDNWGNDYDYNGEGEGLGEGERFSLKIRSYKNHPETGDPMCDASPRVRNRGLFDTFMSEHAHFLLNRKKYKIVCECEIAALADIPNHWDKRYQIGDVVGWINKVSSSISVRDGLGLVEIEMYSL